MNEHQPRSPVADVRPWVVPAVAGGLTIVLFALILAIDVGRAFGGIARLQDVGLAPPAVWFQAFQDRGLAEFAQWILFGWFVVMAAALRVRWRDHDPRTARFWGLVTVFGLLLFAEDAGSVRDTLSHWGDVALPGSSSGELVMAAWFGIIAGVLLYAIVRYGRRVVRNPHVRGYGIAGIVLLAFPSAGQAVEHVLGWMGPFGAWLVYDVLGAGHILELPGFDTPYLVYLFTDFVLEEPLELMGIAFLVAAVLAHARSLPREGATDQDMATTEVVTAGHS